MITQKELMSRLSYNPNTGAFVWKKTTSWHTKPGDIAGTINKLGYVQIYLSGKVYLAHRLAFLWMTGSFPADQVDHIDRDRSNNAWENLRPSTRSQNAVNKRSKNKYGFKGVSQSGRTNRYKARIQMNGVNKHLGCFSTAEEAHEAYCEAARLIHGEYASFDSCVN